METLPMQLASLTGFETYNLVLVVTCTNVHVDIKLAKNKLKGQQMHATLQPRLHEAFNPDPNLD